MTRSEVDYKKMVSSAEAAGFNPLTALRNGGAAGFSTQTRTGGETTEGWGSIIGSGLQAGIDKFMAYDPMDAAKDQQSYDLINAQLKNLDSETARNYAWIGQLNRKGGQSVSGTSPADRPTGAPTDPETGKITVTNPWATFKVDPSHRDAEAFEQRYGDSELGSTAFLIKNATADAIYNLNDWAHSRNAGARVRNAHKNVPTNRGLRVSIPATW